MNEATDAIARALRDKFEPMILGGQMGAAVAHIVAAKPVTMSDTTYWASEQARAHFEHRVAEQITGAAATQFGFATALIIGEDAEQIAMRAPNPNYPPAAGEVEMIWMISVDLQAGVDICRVDIDRPGGNITFGTMLVLEGESRLLEEAPGFGIIREVT